VDVTEELLMRYAELRAHRLMLNGAQRFQFVQRVVAYWLSGSQANIALDAAAKEIGRCA